MNQKYTGNGSTAYKTCMYAALCEDFHENEQGMNFKIQHYQTENKQKHIGFKSILYLFDSKIKIMICSYQIVCKLVKPLFFFLWQPKMMLLIGVWFSQYCSLVIIQVALGFWCVIPWHQISVVSSTCNAYSSWIEVVSTLKSQISAAHTHDLYL